LIFESANKYKSLIDTGKKAMNKTRSELVGICISVFALLAISGPAIAQVPEATVLQLLDSVTVLGEDFGIGLNDDEPPGFDELLSDSELSFIDCDANTAQGIACLDQDKVRIWDSLSNPTDPSELFSCLDDELPVNTRKGNPCTAIAMDNQGNIFIGARLNGTANIVLKIIEEPDGSACPMGLGFTSFTHEVWSDDGATLLTVNHLCYAELATGRPAISDIDVIESEDKRLLILEAKKTALFYSNFEPDANNTRVDEIASGKRDFALDGNEQVTSAAFMEYVRPEDATLGAGESNFFVVATTDRGRLTVVNAETGSAPPGYTKFDLVANRIMPAPAGCPAGEDSFDVAISTKSGVGYATDFSNCSLHVFKPQSDADGNFSGFDTSTAVTMETSISTTVYQPLDVSVSPGIGFDLDDCFPNCEIITGAASLLNVQLASGASNVILYQVAGIPHCAWIPDVCADVLDLGAGDPVKLLIDAGVLRTLVPACNVNLPECVSPQALEFNVTPLLPDEVTVNYQLQTDLDNGADTNGKRVLDSLWLTTDYRAQRFAYPDGADRTDPTAPRINKGFRFNALFFVPEPGVITDGVLEMQFDVSELLHTEGGPGPERGCTLASDLHPGFTLENLLDWDLTVRVSELFENVGNEFIGTPVNIGCINPGRMKSGGISMFPFDFEVTPCPVTLHADGYWRSDTEGGVNCITDPTSLLDDTPDDSVFAKLYDKLYDELLTHLKDFACESFDTGETMAPLSPEDCSTLEANWHNGKLKFDKALGATFDPKGSSGDENFGSVQAQLRNYISRIESALPYGGDPANRVGENAARAQTLQHILVDKLLPSIEAAPNNRFIEGDRTWATD